MAKTESNFINMLITLFGVTLIASVSLALVYNLTKEPIEKSKTLKKEKAMSIVLPKFDKIVSHKALPPESKDSVEVNVAYDNNENVGVAIETYTDLGFGGRIRAIVGFRMDGSIFDVVHLEHKETPGLGDKIEKSKSNWSDQFKGKNSSSFPLKVKKDGGDVDAITASTISSRAYCDAINKAYKVFTLEFKKDNVANETIDKSLTDFQITNDEYFKKVLPTFDNSPLKNVKKIDNFEIFKATNKNVLVGYAIKTCAKGYNDNIWLLTGFLPNGKINNIIVLFQKETVGRGDEIKDEIFIKQFRGIDPTKYKIALKTNGGNVDAISGSTISTEAFCKALQQAIDLYNMEK